MSTTMDQIHHIRDMFYQQDKNISQIASETGLNRKTVSKYVDMEDFNKPASQPESSCKKGFSIGKKKQEWKNRQEEDAWFSSCFVEKISLRIYGQYAYNEYIGKNGMFS